MISFYKTETKVFNANLPKHQSYHRRKSFNFECLIHEWLLCTFYKKSLPRNIAHLSVQLGPPTTDFSDSENEIGHFRINERELRYIDKFEGFHEKTVTQ